MLKEKNPLLKLKLEKEDSIIIGITKIVFEAFYDIFNLILEDPLENFWYEFLGIIFGYAHLFLYLFDKTVSK